jgi:predicted alpha/beta superfamily hydrolase
MPYLGKVKIDWDLNIPNVNYIELLGKYRKDHNFWKIEGYPKSTRAVELDLLPLAPIEIKIHLVFKDGTWSPGYYLQTNALHKNVVPDEVEGRTIHVYLPDGYDKEDTYYPVIYMHDGQNLFCEKLAFVEDWQIDRAAERLVRENKLEKVIIVGIFNSSKRADEYTPFADRRFGGGKARDFSDFVVEKIIPYVESKYRVSKHREDRAVMGSSFGGILSLWMGYAYPEVFSVVGAISPSMWVADGAMLEELERQPKRDIKIWMCQGTEEWSTFTRNTVNILVDKGYKFGKDLVYYEVKDAPHNEVAWARRVECPFILFKGKQVNKCVDIRLDIQRVRQFSVGPVELVVNPIGYFDNGMWFSLYTLAEYSIEPVESSKFDAHKKDSNKTILGEGMSELAIDNMGVVSFGKHKKAKVTVRYDGVERSVILDNPHPPVEHKKKQAKSDESNKSKAKSGDKQK